MSSTPSASPNLFTRFSLISLLILVTIAGFLSWGLQQHQEQVALRQVAEIVSDQMTETLLSVLQPSDLDNLSQPGRFQVVDDLVRERILSEHIILVKLWSSEGEVVYASQQDLIGHRFPVDENLAAALEGEVSMEISPPDGEANDIDRSQYPRLIEVYVPVRFSGSSEVVGALEVYHDLSVVELGMAEMRRFVWMSVFLGFMIFYATLFTLVRRASRELLRRSDQNNRLYREAKEQLAERRRAEGALRESEKRFRSVAQTAVNAIVVADGRGRIVFWNKAARTVFGYREDEAMGMPVSLLMPERYRTAHQRGIERIQSGGARRLVGQTVEMEGLRNDGSEFPLEISLASWEGDGGRFFSAVIRDMTEVREAQQKAQLQDRLAAVGQLAAGIAHDFNNIMGTIILQSELSLNESGLSSGAQARLKTIRQQSLRASKLTSQILDFSRRSLMEPSPMDLALFLNELGMLLERTLPENVHLNVSHAPGKYVVSADVTRLEQVFLNLALNAKDAMPDGGELSIALAKLNIGPDEPSPYQDMADGEWVRITVSDDGTGIPPESLDHIFEPFFTTKPPGEGTGLGLAQVYGIVKQHEGFIDVASRRGEGTTFIIYLPAAGEAARAELALGALPPEKGRAERILVVEDDPAIRGVLVDVLESLKYQVLAAANGREALAVLDEQRQPIDLILSDMVMPEMGGKALMDALDKRHPEAKVVLMSGYPLREDIGDRLDHLKVTLLQKPMTTESIANTVREALQRSP